MKRIFLSVACIMLSVVGYKAAAQDVIGAIPDLSKVVLPPIETLFENAKNAPAAGMYEARVEVNESMLTTEQRSWLKYFKVGGSYQYGNIAVNSTFTNENTPLFLQSTGQTQNTWYGTAAVSVPLDDIFDRKNKAKRQKLEVRYAEMEMEKWLDEQRIRISESYMRAKLFLSTMRMRVEEYTIAQANYEILQKEFQIGGATVADLNVTKKQESESFSRLKTNEFDLLYELFKLEILSKTKIISK